MSVFAARLDRLSRWIDAGLVWIVPALVLLAFALVVARYLFAAGSIAAQELTLWLHAGVFMLGAAGTLRAGGHVRVDVFQQRWSPRRRAAVELAGLLLFLLPFAGFMLWMSLDYVAASFALRESSREPGGLPALWLLKGLIPTTAVLLLVQGVAEVLRALAALRGARP